MINFHKYDFLDVKRLKKYLIDINQTIQLEPTHLYLLSDYYNPYICFTNDFIYIKITIPKLDTCYYPPIGNGNIIRAIENMKEDANENGIEFKLAPITIDNLDLFKELGFNIEEYNSLDTYIYSTNTLALFNDKKMKKLNKNLYYVNKYNQNIYVRGISKEDNLNIFDFFSTYYEHHSKEKYTDDYFLNLSIVKKSLEVLYELELTTVLVYTENEIIGFIIGSVFNNTLYIHLRLALPYKGLDELLIYSTAKSTSKFSKFLTFTPTYGLDYLKELNDKYLPIYIKKFYYGR